MRRAHFFVIGWIEHSQLPLYLRGLDVVVSTSVRSWTETFCIANIEVMACGVPLITFGVGGIGEYVDLDSGAAGGYEQRTRNRTSEMGREGSDQISFSSPQSQSLTSYFHDVEVLSNAILLHAVHPASIAAAVQILQENSSLREAMGRSGRETVTRRFTLNRQMNQYAALYRDMRFMTVQR